MPLPLEFVIAGSKLVETKFKEPLATKSGAESERLFTSSVFHFKIFWLLFPVPEEAELIVLE